MRLELSETFFHDRNMITVAHYLDLLRRSGLVDPTKLDETLAQIESEATEQQLDDVEYVSGQMIARYLITAWHARQLLKGRYKGFFLRQYRILGHLGTGGMSSVYLGEHTLMQRRVAIKVLPRKRLAKSIYLERFIREAQAIAQLDHPNIVRAYDIDHEGDLHYIVMEYFNGENLQKLVEKEGKLPFARVVNILRQTADALAHAHDVGVIHRDVKPSNILVNEQGEAKILDLGLALLDEKLFEGRITHIAEDTILGTADYLAPEQAIDSHHVDARADIYGLGGVLYFCLTGHPPFPEGSVSKRLLAHQQKEPPSIRIDRPDTPDDLVNLCKKMMQKRPEDRHQTAADVAHDLEMWLIEHGYAEPSDLSVSSIHLLSRHHEQSSPLSRSATVKAFQQGKLLQLLHQMDVQESQRSDAGVGASESDFAILGGEVKIDLLDSTAGSSIISKSGAGVRPLVPATPPGEFDDPMLHALNEIERERSLVRREAAKKNPAMATPRSANAPRQPAPVAEKTVKPVAPILPWYRQVPVWFWTLFLSGYAAAIFLAGILFTLLVLMSTGAKG